MTPYQNTSPFDDEQPDETAIEVDKLAPANPSGSNYRDALLYICGQPSKQQYDADPFNLFISNRHLNGW